MSMRAPARPAWGPRRLVAVFVAWKVLGTIVLACTIDRMIPAWEGADVLRNSHDPLRAFRNWDAAHYLTIARDGYVDQIERVFYPLFPWLLRVVTMVIGEPVVAGLVLATILSSLFAVVYVRFARRFVSAPAAGAALLALIAFPSAFFLNSIYTEPLFLLLMFLFLASFFERSWLAAPVAVLLVLTRGQGIFVGAGVGLVLALESPAIWRTRDWARAAYLIGIGATFVAALAGFMVYNWWAFGDPLEFMHVQTKLWQGGGRFAIGNSFDPVHVVRLLVGMPSDLNGPIDGLIDKLCLYATILVAPFVWRLDRSLFAFYFCLAYFPGTMGYGGSYFRYFLLPYSLAALGLAQAYEARSAIFGIAKERVAAWALALGFALQAGFSLLHAAFRWVG